MDVDVIVSVSVSAPVIVAALVSGNEIVEVIDPVDIKIDQLHHRYRHAALSRSAAPIGR